MKFKVDENLPVEVAELLRDAGHDAITIHDEELVGADDEEIAPVFLKEERAFLTFDLGFADIRSYPPSEYLGLVVFRLKSQDKLHVLDVCKQLLTTIEREELARRRSVKCPGCEGELAEGYVYLRGFGTSLHWSERSDVSWLSRSGLETVDLREYSLRPPRAQATCSGGRCRQCGALVLFRGDSDPSSHV